MFQSTFVPVETTCNITSLGSSCGLAIHPAEMFEMLTDIGGCLVRLPYF